MYEMWIVLVHFNNKTCINKIEATQMSEEKVR